MNRYDNYSPEIPVREEVPAAPKADKESSQRRQKEPRRRRPKADTQKKKESPKINPQRVATLKLIFGLLLGAVALYLGVAFISYFTECVRDQASISAAPIGTAKDIGNAAGEGGARLAEMLINESFGLGSLVLVVWLACVSLHMLVGRPRFKVLNFTIKCLVALITVSLIIGLFTIASNTPVNWGGYHGRYVNEFLIHMLGWTGAVILCLFCMSVFVVICMRDVVKWILRKHRQILDHRRAIAEAKAEEKRRAAEIEEMRLREAAEAAKAGESLPAESDSPSDIEDEYVKFNGSEAEIDSSITGYSLEDTDDVDEPLSDNTPKPHLRHEATYELEDEPKPEDEPQAQYGPATDGAAADGDGMTADDGRQQPDGDESEEKMVVSVNDIAQVDKAAAPSGHSLKGLYKFPPATLLREGDNHISVDVAEQEANQERIRETLLYHGIPITDISAKVGPTVTLYEVKPDQGIKIARIKNLADDIALSLAAIGVRIIAPIPGKGAVGIEVANNEPQTVSMRTLIQSRKYAESRYKLPVALGCTIGNEVYMADLTKMPHLLVAGATGQGKSVGLNAIIASLLYKKRPDELKFVMIDPKMLEFSLYAKIEKHYLAKIPGDGDAIVTDMKQVVHTLLSLCEEMDQRYALLKAAGVRNIEEYNAKIESGRLDYSQGHRFLPYIVVVVDEFADLIMMTGKEAETPIARLAQKARAAGMHVIIATQRPSTNVITGIIKANFPVRVAFKVSSGVDSKTILDCTGAQSLIGRGDMLVSINSQLERVQCAFIDTPEVEAICDYISRQPFNSGPYILPEPKDLGDGEGGGGGFSGELDELFEECARWVVESGSASTSMLQRHFRIGYNRAGNIMDQMEAHGFVGPASGGKARELKIDAIGLDAALQSLRK